MAAKSKLLKPIHPRELRRKGGDDEMDCNTILEDDGKETGVA